MFMNSALVLVFGQVKYEAGYYIDNNDVRHAGLILNKDWKNNPVEFGFKTTEPGLSQQMSLGNVKEFGIGDLTKYVRASVNIDTSKVKTYKRGPQWMAAEVFLRVVIESSDIALFQWTEREVTKYFFKVQGKGPEQLVYKKYRVAGKGEQLFFLATNTDYLFQLEQSVMCVGSGKPDLKCTYKDLKKYFADAIKCRQLPIIFDEQDQKKIKFSLAAQIGYELSAFETNGRLIANTYNFEYPKGKSIRFGLEGEVILPFGKNKWSLVIAPSFKSYEGTSKEILGHVGYIKYSGLEFPAGVSYNFAFKKGRAFLRGYVVQDFLFGSKFTNDISGPRVDIALNPRLNPSFGGGITVKNLSLEARYYLPKRFLNGGGWSSQYQSIALFVSYKLLN